MMATTAARSSGDDDECPILAQLSGDSMVTFVETSSWSCLIPENFIGAARATGERGGNFSMQVSRKNLLRTCCIYAEGEAIMGCSTGRGLTKAVQQLIRQSVTLRDTQPNDVVVVVNPHTHQPFIRPPPPPPPPLFVHVVAKKRPDVSVSAKDGRMNLAFQCVIADQSGYGTLCVFNEGGESIYDNVDVGDLLVLQHYKTQRNRLSSKTQVEGLFSKRAFIDIEIKVQHSGARHLLIEKFRPGVVLTRGEVERFTFPLVLFAPTSVLMLPYRIECDDGVPESSVDYFDIIGVVAHVGRLIRVRASNVVNVACKTEGGVVRKQTTTYALLRNICIFDERSSLLKVRIVVESKECLRAQEDIVPGQLLVLTHCTTRLGQWTGKYVRTSEFSQVCTGRDVERYYLTRPESAKEVAASLMSRDGYLEAVTRRDITFSAGGHDDLCLDGVHEHISSLTSRHVPPDWKTSVRRPVAVKESRRVVFRGEIVHVVEVSDDSAVVANSTVVYSHPGYAKVKDATQATARVGDYHHQRNGESSEWRTSFKRKLTPFDVRVLQETRRGKATKRICDPYKPLCLPLILPPDSNYRLSSQGDEASTECHRLDGPPYFIVDILDNDQNTLYSCLWKNGKIAHSEKRLRLAEAGQVYCLVDIYCVSGILPLEVILQDLAKV